MTTAAPHTCECKQPMICIYTLSATAAWSSSEVQDICQSSYSSDWLESTINYGLAQPSDLWRSGIVVTQSSWSTSLPCTNQQWPVSVCISHSGQLSPAIPLGIGAVSRGVNRHTTWCIRPLSVFGWELSASPNGRLTNRPDTWPVWYWVNFLHVSLLIWAVNNGEMKAQFAGTQQGVNTIWHHSKTYKTIVKNAQR